jgi:hypothetical protein
MIDVWKGGMLEELVLLSFWKYVHNPHTLISTIRLGRLIGSIAQDFGKLKIDTLLHTTRPIIYFGQGNRQR